MPASDPLGIDLAVTTDLDPTFRLCYGAENLGNALLRRLNAEAGSLDSIGDDPNYGYALANATMDERTKQGDLADISAKVNEQLSQDERVQSVNARILAELE